MTKNNVLRQRWLAKIFLFFALVTLTSYTSAFAKDNTKINTFVKDLLGIKNNNFSIASIYTDNSKKIIDIENPQDGIFSLQISKISSEWKYHFHNFPLVSFLNQDQSWKFILNDSSTSIQITGNTFTNTESAISVLDAAQYAPKLDSQDYTEKFGSDKTIEFSSKIDSFFTVDQTIYKITGKSTVSYVKTLSTARKYKIPSSVSYKNTKYTVTTISSYSFSNNKRIKKIIIPDSITTIEKKAFENCIHLNKIVIKSSKINTIEMDAFKGINKHAKFSIYSKTKKKYRSLVKKIKKSTNRKKITFSMIKKQ